MCSFYINVNHALCIICYMYLDIYHIHIFIAIMP